MYVLTYHYTSITLCFTSIQRGANVSGEVDKVMIAEAVKAAADVDIVVVGLGLCGNNYGSDADPPCNGKIDEAEGSDRRNIHLPSAQIALLEALNALDKPIVAFVMAAGAIDLSPLNSLSNVCGILWTGYPGEYGGQAIADVILGAYNPSGRLPFTIYPGNFTQQVRYDDMSLRPSKPDELTSSPGRTYRFFEVCTYLSFLLS